MPRNAMTLNSLRSVSCFALLWLLCYVPVLAQISDGLYKTLPDSLKPKNKAALTVLEKQRILKNVAEIYVDTYANEFKSMADFLDKEIGQATNEKLKIDIKYSLGIYCGFRDDTERSIMYFKEAINDIGERKEYNKILAWCNTQLAAQYYGISKDDNVTIGFLHNSFQVLGKDKDSVLISLNYNIYSLIYFRLLLYEKAIYYCNMALKTAPSRVKWNPEYTGLVLQKGFTFENYFGASKNQAYADSATFYIRKVMAQKAKEPEHWYAECYYHLGSLCYSLGMEAERKGDIDSLKKASYELTAQHYYKRGKQLLDSATTSKYNQSAYDFPNNFPRIYMNRALCLIKIGDYKKGKKTLDSLHITGLTSLREVYKALFQYAKRNHDWQTALYYHEKWRAVLDSINIPSQRGKIFEAEQKYNVSQKELTIANLENQNLVKEKENRNLLAGGVLGILALATLGYAANRRQQAVVQKERAQLTENLHRIEEEMNLKLIQEQAEKDMAIANQRMTISRDMHDEVSSSLVTLQYYIADIKQQMPDADMKAVIKDIEQEAHQVYVQARQFMHNLHTSAARSQYNILDFLHHLSLGFGKGSSLKIYTEVDEEAVLRYFTPLQHNELYAIIKEAVANSLKHSGASRLDITLTYEAGTFQFSIADNGKGMGGPSSRGQSSRQGDTGMGIMSLSKRMEVLNGTLAYDSTSAGTRIVGSFPV